MRLRIEQIEAPLRDPFLSAKGEVGVRQLVLVTLTDDDGQTGYGEAAPLPHYDGVTVGDVLGALEDCRRPLKAAGAPRAELLAACSQAAVLPQAIAAIDLALWDLEGRRAAEPVWRLLAANPPPPLQVNATLTATDRAGAAAQAAAAAQAGFTTVKLKVGIGDDAGRLAAVRAAAGPRMAIRIDANGAWSVQEAQDWLRVLVPAGIELCEEPVSGADQTAALRDLTAVPIAIDETTAAPGALDRRLCEAACLKISRCGGITGVIAAAARARQAGYEVYLASTLDGPLGIAAALHAAAVVGPDRPCGLATLAQFAGREDPLPASAGAIAAPVGPGLGDGLLQWYRAV